jgi:hypothetical protein
MDQTTEYWKKRCELAEKFIAESPDDPDVTANQLKAYQEWIEFKRTTTLADDIDSPVSDEEMEKAISWLDGVVSSKEYFNQTRLHEQDGCRITEVNNIELPHIKID